MILSNIVIINIVKSNYSYDVTNGAIMMFNKPLTYGRYIWLYFWIANAQQKTHFYFNLEQARKRTQIGKNFGGQYQPLFY